MTKTEATKERERNYRTEARRRASRLLPFVCSYVARMGEKQILRTNNNILYFASSAKSGRRFQEERERGNWGEAPLLLSRAHFF